jgi:hypothetical protein
MRYPNPAKTRQMWLIDAVSAEKTQNHEAVKGETDSL